MADQQATPRPDHSEAIAEFSGITGETATAAKSILEASGWVMESALGLYYESRDGQRESDEDDAGDEEAHEAPVTRSNLGTGTSGGHLLGREGDSVPSQPGASSSSDAGRSRQPQQQRKFGTLRDLQSDSHAGHGHGQDDDEASDKEQEFYAGGDKSGLAVQDPSSSNPLDQIQRLMNTARRGGPRPPRADGGSDEPPRRNNFGGAGQTLGGDDVESQPVPATETSRQSRGVEMVERILHLWQDGFSVDDGPLYRYDDPANRRTLDMINSGSAPMDLMNVQNGQAVDVKLMNHPNENYVQPKKKYKPFEGSGQRLGSPVPGVASSSTTTTAPAPSTDSATASTPAVEVDNSQPTMNLQIRLADGTRMPSRFNTSHTIGDVYDFVERSQPGGFQSSWVLATTFPTRDLTDKSQILGDMKDFKRGGVLVQKWT